MLKLPLKRTRGPKKRRTKSKRSLPTRKPKTKRSLITSKKLNESKKRRKERSSAFVSSKRRPQTDRLKSMPSELKEPKKKAKEKPEKGKDSSRSRDKESLPISKWLDKSNSRRRQMPWLNRPELKERTT